MDDTLPGCIGYFGKPITPNNCHSCGWAELCRKIVARERLASLMAAVREAKAVIRGEK